jgi:hypothetical protein
MQLNFKVINEINFIDDNSLIQTHTVVKCEDAAEAETLYRLLNKYDADVELYGQLDEFLKDKTAKQQTEYIAKSGRPRAKLWIYWD